MYKLLATFLFIISWYSASAQYSDYIGAGHNDGITVTSSDEFQAPAVWQEMANAENTISGKGMNFDHYKAARFLEQASLGYEKRHIDDVVNLGFETWIDNQFTLQPSYTLPEAQGIYTELNEEEFRPSWLYFTAAYWDINMNNDDLLRHRIATAFSEIMVVSRLGDLTVNGEGLAAYYDILLENAFGNFEDLLYDVALSPTMGVYLTHINNPKTNLVNQTRPDENFARELMQLFSIGLYELNIDGSRKLDSQGNSIPTYGQTDIKQLAKVFTGLSFGEAFWDYRTPVFGLIPYDGDFTVPMIMYDTDDPTTSEDEDQHEDGNKVLFGNQIVEDNPSGLAEIADAINILFNHENVGPFMSHLLIQTLIKSNPSPAYIARVATVFNDNGQGVRGDMKSVIKAILMDSEARDCIYQEDDKNSRLKEPMLKYIHMARTLDISSSTGQNWNNNFRFTDNTKQDILAAPSVFNFWSPIHGPYGAISNSGLVAPEFQLFDSRTSIGYFNSISNMTGSGNILIPAFSSEYSTWNLNQVLPLIEDPENYLNWLDMHFTHGELTDHTRKILKEAMLDFNPAENQVGAYKEWRAREIMYLLLVSPDYSVTR